MNRKILIAARALIEDAKRWTTGACARDTDGDIVQLNSDEAYCFCALGAVFRVVKKNLDLAFAAEKELEKAASELFGKTMIDVNDELGHAAVLRMYSWAIERC
jgi:hypothetical protein